MVDLHVHSIWSDGTQTPEEIVAAALEKGLTAVAVADHDTVAGVRPALEAAEGTALTVVPAAEISTEYQAAEVHILGYYFDLKDPRLADTFRYVRSSRLLRGEEIAGKLRALGIELTLGEIEAESDGDTLGRPHVAAALLRKGYVSTLQEAFDRYIGAGRPAYVPRYKLTPFDAVARIAQAGGCPVLAHPGLGVGTPVIRELAGRGLQGIEAYHSQHTPSNTRRALGLAEEYGLVVTGGTDSHGPGGSHPVEVGEIEVPDECFHSLLAWAREHDAHIPE